MNELKLKSLLFTSFKTDNPHCDIIFRFTDCDYNDSFESHEEMRRYAKETYIEEYENDVNFTAYFYNKYYDSMEPIQSVYIGDKLDVDTCIKFAENLLRFYNIKF